MPLIYAPKLTQTLISVVKANFTLEARVEALEDAVTQLQQQITKMQTMINTMQVADAHGYNSSGLADPQILVTLTNVLVPFFDA